MIATYLAGDYPPRQRLDMAAHLLRTTDRSIEEISFQCGYIEHDTVSIRFREVYGMPPKAYRQENTVDR